MLRRAVFLLLIAAGGYLPIAAGTFPTGVHAAEADAAALERINAAIATVEQKLAASRDARSAVAAEIETSEKAILANQRQIDAVRVALTQQQMTLADLRIQQQQLAADSAAQQELIAGYARSAWMSGNEEYLKLVLNQEDPAQSARMLRYYRYFTAARAERLAAFNLTRSELARVAGDLDAATAVLEQQQEELALKQDELAADQQQRQSLLTSLDAELATRDAELQRLEMDRVEIEILLQELQSSLADGPLVEEQESFVERKGQLPWPLDGPHLNDYGSRHSLGDLTWEGVTIGATAGADIRAIHHGRVIFADWFTTSGLLLIIDHGDGYMSLYAHNQELYKAVGEWVSPGDVVAAAGNTGGQRDPSLYFEIRRNGRAENPVAWCMPR